MAIRPLKFPLVMGMNHLELKGSGYYPHVAFQKVDGEEKLMLWLTVNDSCEPEKHRIFVALTGQTLPGPGEHLGSALTGNTTFVVHVYRLQE